MFKPVRLAVVALLCGVSHTPAFAEDAAVTAARFGALEDVRQIAISPDGAHISYVVNFGPAGQVMYVADLSGKEVPKPIVRQTEKGMSLRRCSWTTDERLICQMRIVVSEPGYFLGYSRMFAVNSDGSNVAKLTIDVNSNSLRMIQNGGDVIARVVADKPGHVLMTRQYSPESTTGYLTSKISEGLGVEDIDTVTLKRVGVEKANSSAVDYIADGKGVVRVMGTRTLDDDGLMKNRLRYTFRKLGDRNWQLLSQVTESDGVEKGMYPVAVDSVNDVAYGFTDKGGHRALYSVALNGSGKSTLLLARPDVDIDSVIQIGRDERVVGASYATERRNIEFFDPELKKLGAALGKALPGNPDIAFIDASADENKLLLLASSDTNPGMFYVYDKTNRKLGEILPVRSLLASTKLAEMKPVSYPAADGTLIPAYLTLPVGSTGKGIPAIVMPHGGPSSRDEWGFDWLVQFFAARGYAVLQPNYRGSAGYGSDWYRRNGFQSWRTAIGDVNDAGRWLQTQGIAAPGKLAIVGWSYGGYAALQASMLDADLFKAIVAVAPVTDLEKLRSESSRFSNSLLVDKFIGHGAHIVEGSPAQNAAKIKAPVLMFHGDQDENVGIGESRFMLSKLKSAGKQAELIEFPGLDHYLDDGAVRAKLLSTSDAFLRKALKIE